jgi:hypothetical protein
MRPILALSRMFCVSVRLTVTCLACIRKFFKGASQRMDHSGSASIITTVR